MEGNKMRPPSHNNNNNKCPPKRGNRQVRINSRAYNVADQEGPTMSVEAGILQRGNSNRKVLKRSSTSALQHARTGVDPAAAVGTGGGTSGKRERILRRTRSADPRMGESMAIRMRRNHTQSSIRRIGTGKKYYHSADHSGDRKTYRNNYSFWSSKPALTMFCFLGLSLRCHDGRYLYGALLVFLYEISVVLATWRRFIARHPIVQEFSEFTLEWFHYSLQQAERFCDRHDRSRKMAVGLFKLFYPEISENVADYIRERRATMTARTLAEASRMQKRLADLQEKGKRAARMATSPSRRKFRQSSQS